MTVGKKTRIVLVDATVEPGFYEHVAGLSHNPFDLPLFYGYKDGLLSYFKLRVSDEDLDYLLLKFRTLKCTD